MRVASLFSGIGGFEIGLKQVGAYPVLLCENDAAATAVLDKHFSNVAKVGDIKELDELPDSDLLVAGWPCQDLSQAGQTSGLRGKRSSLIEDVFRTVENSNQKPTFIILENVAFALSLAGGEALQFATQQLETHGYNWAFRILDSNFFGLPQRRRRLFILGSLAEKPEDILFDSIQSAPKVNHAPSHVGFYWTEGNRGLGWTPDAVPPLKGGSNLSIPSPPAIWDLEEDRFYTPSIEDAERLQGFEKGWTELAKNQSRASNGQRWRQVGNAVSVNVAEWLGKQLMNSRQPVVDDRLVWNLKGANAGWGGPDRKPIYFRKIFEGPADSSPAKIQDFGFESVVPLSERASKGFYGRYLAGSLRENRDFSDALNRYCRSFNLKKASYSHVA